MIITSSIIRIKHDYKYMCGRFLNMIIHVKCSQSLSSFAFTTPFRLTVLNKNDLQS